MPKRPDNVQTFFAQLSSSLNRAPLNPHHIHLVGICGAGMAPLAGILRHEGYLVSGSDENIYPPMSDLLEDWAIPVRKGYSAANLTPRPDLVIVGNVITRHNPEAMELSRLKIPYLSLPQALRHFAMRKKKSIVVCGTHGKTTTSALAAWVLESAGKDPSFFVGGVPNNLAGNFKLGKGPLFVIEGDEYDTAFFDKGPKFFHYKPWIVILTSIEFDHADIYRDLDHVIENFRKLIGLIPADGLLIANNDDPIVNTTSKHAKCPVVTYGFGPKALWRAEGVTVRAKQTYLKILKRNEVYVELLTPLYGHHNISNLLSTAALSDHLKIDVPLLSKAMEGFKGIKRRQEVKGEKRDILILDDFAHHPTSVRETLTAVKDKYRGRRLIAVFEPRSNSSRRRVFQDEYARSFDKADVVFIPEPPLMEKIPPEERFSSPELVESLNRKGVDAHYCPDTHFLLDQIVQISRQGDVILVMSNGPFDNLPERLLERL